MNIFPVGGPNAHTPAHTPPTTNNPTDWVNEAKQANPNYEVKSVQVTKVTDPAPKVVAEVGPPFKVRAAVTCKVVMTSTNQDLPTLTLNSPRLFYEATMPDGMSEADAEDHFDKVADLYCKCHNAQFGSVGQSHRDSLDSKIAGCVDASGAIHIQGLSDGSHTKLIAETSGSSKSTSVELREERTTQAWRVIKHISKGIALIVGSPIAVLIFPLFSKTVQRTYSQYFKTQNTIVTPSAVEGTPSSGQVASSGPPFATRSPPPAPVTPSIHAESDYSLGPLQDLANQAKAIDSLQFTGEKDTKVINQNQIRYLSELYQHDIALQAAKPAPDADEHTKAQWDALRANHEAHVRAAANMYKKNKLQQKDLTSDIAPLAAEWTAFIMHYTPDDSKISDQINYLTRALQRFPSYTNRSPLLELVLRETPSSQGTTESSYSPSSTESSETASPSASNNPTPLPESSLTQQSSPSDEEPRAMARAEPETPLTSLVEGGGQEPIAAPPPIVLAPLPASEQAVVTPMVKPELPPAFTEEQQATHRTTAARLRNEFLSQISVNPTVTNESLDRLMKAHELFQPLKDDLQARNTQLEKVIEWAKYVESDRRASLEDKASAKQERAVAETLLQEEGEFERDVLAIDVELMREVDRLELPADQKKLLEPEMTAMTKQIEAKKVKVYGLESKVDKARTAESEANSEAEKATKKQEREEAERELEAERAIPFENIVIPEGKRPQFLTAFKTKLMFVVNGTNRTSKTIHVQEAVSLYHIYQQDRELQQALAGDTTLTSLVKQVKQMGSVITTYDPEKQRWLNSATQKELEGTNALIEVMESDRGFIVELHRNRMFLQDPGFIAKLQKSDRQLIRKYAVLLQQLETVQQKTRLAMQRAAIQATDHQDLIARFYNIYEKTPEITQLLREIHEAAIPLRDRINSINIQDVTWTSPAQFLRKLNGTASAPAVAFQRAARLKMPFVEILKAEKAIAPNIDQFSLEAIIDYFGQVQPYLQNAEIRHKQQEQINELLKNHLKQSPPSGAIDSLKNYHILPEEEKIFVRNQLDGYFVDSDKNDGIKVLDQLKALDPLADELPKNRKRLIFDLRWHLKDRGVKQKSAERGATRDLLSNLIAVRTNNSSAYQTLTNYFSKATDSEDDSRKNAEGMKILQELQNEQLAPLTNALKTLSEYAATLSKDSNEELKGLLAAIPELSENNAKGLLKVDVNKINILLKTQGLTKVDLDNKRLTDVIQDVFPIKM